MKNQNAETGKNEEGNLADIKNIPTIQIKGQFLMIDRRNCGGKCVYKQ